MEQISFRAFVLALKRQKTIGSAGGNKRRYLKGKSSLMIFDRRANLKYKYGNRHFCSRGYYVDTIGKNEKKIAEYIQNQLKEDMMEDQISLKEYIVLLGSAQTTRKTGGFDYLFESNTRGFGS